MMEIKGSYLIKVSEEISRQSNIQAVAGVMLVTIRQIYTENQEIKKQRRMTWKHFVRQKSSTKSAQRIAWLLKKLALK